MTKMNSLISDWTNYWQGRSELEKKAHATGVGIEQSEELAEFWTRVFAQTGEGFVLDLACGAGAVLHHAAAKGLKELIGVDISTDAVAVTCRSLPSVLGIVASADALPLADRSVALVVSQFGFEYAEHSRVAAEIARILRPGGAFHAIAHLRSGAIEEECNSYLAHVQSIEQSGYMPAVRQFFKSLYKFERTPSPVLRGELNQAFESFTQCRTTLMQQIIGGGIASQLHHSVNNRYQRRREYSESDILAWLDDWQRQIAAFAGRMSNMVNSAIDSDEAAAILSRISPHGQYCLEKFEIGGRAAAWKLSANV